MREGEVRGKDGERGGRGGNEGHQKKLSRAWSGKGRGLVAYVEVIESAAQN